MYCRTVGELDSVLHYLHMAWAKLVERDDDLRDAIAMQLGDDGTSGILNDDDRLTFLTDGGSPLTRVKNFWARIDAQLDCRVQTDKW